MFLLISRVSIVVSVFVLFILCLDGVFSGSITASERFSLEQDSASSWCIRLNFSSDCGSPRVFHFIYSQVHPGSSILYFFRLFCVLSCRKFSQGEAQINLCLPTTVFGYIIALN